MKESKKKRPKALSEDEAYRIALNDHPEYKRMIDEGNLPDEIVDEEGNAMSPRAHLAMHQIVERQLASKTNPGAWSTSSGGCSRWALAAMMFAISSRRPCRTKCGTL